MTHRRHGDAAPGRGTDRRARLRPFRWPASALAGVIVILAGAGCGEGIAGSGDATAEIVPYSDGVRVAWDVRTLRRLVDGPVSYPRMTRLSDGDLLVSFEAYGGSHVVLSEDEGRTWSDPIEAASADGDVIAAVPSLLQLADGEILLAYNTRPPEGNTDPDRRIGIKVVVSSDGGRTWRPRADVFEGGYRWRRGVWEPAMIQLASGEILLYFANEFPFANTAEQEISVVRSSDQGRTWSEPETVSYRQGHRDGMPVPLQLRNGTAIVVAIEDDGVVDGPFKPVVLELPADGSIPGVIGGDSERRHPALAPSASLPDASYGGAPYIVQLPTGETVLSFQSNEDRPGDWSQSAMVVATGTENARDFDHKSRPFRVPDGRWALWNALFVKDSVTVTALSSTNAFDPAHQELYSVDGHVIRGQTLPRSSIQVDGDGGEADWERSTELFVGAHGDKVAEVALAWDPDRLLARFTVTEGDVLNVDGPSERDDAVQIALATGLLTGDAPVQGVYRLRVEADGGAQLYAGDGGQWASVDPGPLEVAVSEAVPAATPAFDGVRYVVEVGLPWASVGGRPSADGVWGLTVGIVNRTAEGWIFREWISGTRPDRPSTWLEASLRSS